MGTTDTICQLLDRGENIFLASVAVKNGLSRNRLAKLVEDGQLERVDRGVYVRAGELGDELFAMQQRAKKIVYSHETALFLHGLSDRTPIRHAITVPSSYKPSQAIKGRCKVYYIKPNLIDLGRTRIQSGMGHSITAYDVERTICDVIRSRNKMDGQIFIDALKSYAAKRDKDLNRLDEYANRLGVYKLLRQYLEVLL